MTRLEQMAQAASPYAWNDGFWNGAIDGKQRSSMAQPTAKKNAMAEVRRVLECAKGLTTSPEVLAFLNGVLAEHPPER